MRVMNTSIGYLGGATLAQVTAKLGAHFLMENVVLNDINLITQNKGSIEAKQCAQNGKLQEHRNGGTIGIQCRKPRLDGTTHAPE